MNQARLIHDAIEQLAALVEVFERRRDTLALQAGITVEQWRVMEEIARGTFMPSMFARRRESSAAGVSRTLRRLLDAGLVSVSVSGADRRHRKYSLTPSGARSLAGLTRSRKAAIRSVWMGLEPHEIEAFADFTRKLVSAIETYSRRLRLRPRLARAAIVPAQVRA